MVVNASVYFQMKPEFMLNIKIHLIFCQHLQKSHKARLACARQNSVLDLKVFSLTVHDI